MKKRLAIWIHGGIGHGDFSQGYPMLEKLVIRLCEQFDIVIYSHVPPDESYSSDKFQIKFPPRSVKIGKLGWIYLLCYFFQDQRKRKFDIVFSFWGYPNGFFVVLLGKLFNIPSVISVLGADSASIKSIDYGIFHKRIPRFIASWSYKRSDELLAISEYQKNQLIQFGIKRKIQVIQWGADCSMYFFKEKKRGEVLQFIHVAHINPVKDQATLLKAFAIIARSRPVQLKIFGLDKMNGELQKICNELSIEKLVQFEGVIPYNKMVEQYHAADCMFHTSLSEGQSMALTEAAATGVLMAGTGVGLLSDLGEKCGVLIEAGDYSALAQKILALLDNPAEWNEKIQNARSWSVEHDLDWSVKELASVIENNIDKYKIQASG